MPNSVMPSAANKRKVFKEKMPENLEVLAETPRLKHFFSSKTLKQQR